MLDSDGTHLAAVLPGPPEISVLRVRTTFVDAQARLSDGGVFVGGNVTPDQALAYALCLAG